MYLQWNNGFLFTDREENLYHARFGSITHYTQRGRIGDTDYHETQVTFIGWEIRAIYPFDEMMTDVIVYSLPNGEWKR